MAQYSYALDGIFLALADPTRRAVLERLGRAAATISELAKPFGMTLPSFMKHIRFLESSGWIRTRKQGRVRTCSLEKQTLSVAETWLSAQQAIWEDRTDRLERFVVKTGTTDTKEGST